MFRKLAKFSVTNFHKYNLAYCRNVGHTLDCQGVFPSILRKSIIQAWRPMFGSSVHNPPAKYVEFDDESYYEKLIRKFGLNSQYKTLFVNSTLNILNKCGKKIIEPNEIKPNKQFKISFKTAGKFRKFIGDKPFTYFGTDATLRGKKSGGDADPCKSPKKRKNPKKKKGGACPYIKEECKGGRKGQGGGRKGRTCQKLTSDPCGSKKQKTDTSKKKIDSCGDAESHSKKDCSKSVACKKKGGDKKSASCSAAASSKKKGGAKKSSSCSKAIPCKKKGSDAKKGKKSASCSKAIPCKTKGSTKSSSKKDGKKKDGGRPTCPSKDDSCKSSKGFHDSCSSKASQRSGDAKGDLCKQERGDPCKKKEKKEEQKSSGCKSRGDPCSSKKKPRCE